MAGLGQISVVRKTEMGATDERLVMELMLWGRNVLNVFWTVDAEAENCTLTVTKLKQWRGNWNFGGALLIAHRSST